MMMTDLEYVTVTVDSPAGSVTKSFLREEWTAVLASLGMGAELTSFPNEAAMTTTFSWLSRLESDV